MQVRKDSLGAFAKYFKRSGVKKEATAALWGLRFLIAVETTWVSKTVSTAKLSTMPSYGIC
jgi:hypothetical protein